MRQLFKVICFALVLLINLFALTTKASQIKTDDLLNPEVPFPNANFEVSKELATPPKLDPQPREDLLGPEDTFPFLPDNHRDSGTGKFNAF